VSDLDPVQIRVLGCLLEKQQTTPDAYPLTLNALRLACNQSTNREPVVDYDEPAVRAALQQLGRRRWTRLTSSHSSRAPKYRHLLQEELGLGRDEQALLAVLLLRGPQTLGELKLRTERMHPFADLATVESTLERLTGRRLGHWLERRPGQKEARYTHSLGEDGGQSPQPAATPGAAAVEPREAGDGAASEDTGGDLSIEVAALRRDVEALRDEVARLRRRLEG
jgi:uncharacterized protein YceH (UPF0502 family)